jgi:beta-glucanase (GH16 family)
MRNSSRKSIALAITLTTAAALGVAGTSQPANAASSTAMPVGNVTSYGRTWHQVYKENFSTTASLGQFSKKYPKIASYNGYDDTSGHGLYDPAHVLSVHNGVLDFDLHTISGKPRVSSIAPDNYLSLKTGRFSIRYKTTKTAGYKFVGMFWPSDDVWNEGEIDWPEADLGAKPRPASAIAGSYHDGTMTFMPGYQKFAATDTTGWHTATTEWGKGVIRFYWDGKLLLTVTKGVPTQAMHVQLQAETAIAEPSPKASAVGHVDIDWISIWK